MKTVKILFYTLLIGLCACNSKENAPSNNYFKEGEEVTLTILAPGFDDSQLENSNVARRIYGSENITNKINFYFAEGDEITVKMGDKTSQFNIVNFQPRATSLEFKGKMPADGDKFDVIYGEDNVKSTQYAPINNIDDNVVHIRNGYMRFEAKNATLGSTIAMNPMWSAIKLDLPISSFFENISDDELVNPYKRLAISSINVELGPKEGGTPYKTYTYMAESGNLIAGADGKTSDPVLHCYIVVDTLKTCKLTTTINWSGADFIGYANGDNKTIELELKDKNISPSVETRVFPVAVEPIPGYVVNLSLNIPYAFGIRANNLSVTWKKKNP